MRCVSCRWRVSTRNSQRQRRPRLWCSNADGSKADGNNGSGGDDNGYNGYGYNGYGYNGYGGNDDDNINININIDTWWLAARAPATDAGAWRMVVVCRVCLSNVCFDIQAFIEQARRAAAEATPTRSTVARRDWVRRAALARTRDNNASTDCTKNSHISARSHHQRIVLPAPAVATKASNRR